MTFLMEKVPSVDFKPGKMLNSWLQGARLCALLAAAVLYIYILLYLKALYLKDERLNKIALLAKDTEQMIQKIKSLDQQLAADLEHLQDLYDNY